MADKPISKAEQKRRSDAASTIIGAATTLELYGHDPVLAARLHKIADDILKNGAKR